MIKDRITRRAFSKNAIAAAAALAVPRIARAQNYPSRPIRFILPFAAGGVADITSRLAAEKLGEKLGQRFVVENQPGPGGIAAARTVLTASPDGYTLGLVTNGTSISVAIYNALPFDPVKDFSTDLDARLFRSHLRQQLGVRNLKPRTISSRRHARSPASSTSAPSMSAAPRTSRAELFKSSAELNFQIIPYRGTPEIIIALLRNDVQLMVDFYAPMKGALVDKKIRALATSGARAR